VKLKCPEFEIVVKIWEISEFRFAAVKAFDITLRTIMVIY
jgi:hypothetical protein